MPSICVSRTFNMHARPHYVFKNIDGRPTRHIYEAKNGRLLAIDTQDRRASSHECDDEATPPSPTLASPTTIFELIEMWRAPDPVMHSPEWRALAPNTQRMWGAALDRIALHWGHRTLAQFDNPRIKAEIVAWRDRRASRPRGADIGVVVLQALLKFGQLRGLVSHNAARGVPPLYHGGDRAEIVWTDDELEQMHGKAQTMGLSHAVDALRLAAACGLRRADLLTLTWEHVGEFAICKKAKKSSRRRRRYVSIPRIPELDELLEELRAKPRQPGVENVLVNQAGSPWHPDWLTRQIGKVRDALGIAHVDPDTGLKRKKHLHDARGTYATRLIRRAGLSDEAVADIMGWSPTEVARIRRVYVDSRAVAIAIGERVRRDFVAKDRISA
jgi:integrase